jgi:hypothetical protein
MRDVTGRGGLRPCQAPRVSACDASPRVSCHRLLTPRLRARRRRPRRVADAPVQVPTSSPGASDGGRQSPSAGSTGIVPAGRTGASRQKGGDRCGSVRRREYVSEQPPPTARARDRRKNEHDCDCASEGHANREQEIRQRFARSLPKASHGDQGQWYRQHDPTDDELP